jgi:REP element-mobilizing transposase RayT
VKFSERHAWGFWIVNRDGSGQSRRRGKPKYITSLANMPVWQRNDYDHAIRNESALSPIRQYIADNPAR